MSITKITPIRRYFPVVVLFLVLALLFFVLLVDIEIQS